MEIILYHPPSFISSKHSLNDSKFIICKCIIHSQSTFKTDIILFRSIIQLFNIFIAYRFESESQSHLFNRWEEYIFIGIYFTRKHPVCCIANELHIIQIMKSWSNQFLHSLIMCGVLSQRIEIKRLMNKD